jgi:hypothetical protein
MTPKIISEQNKKLFEFQENNHRNLSYLSGYKKSVAILPATFYTCLQQCGQNSAHEDNKPVPLRKETSLIIREHQEMEIHKYS